MITVAGLPYLNDQIDDVSARLNMVLSVASEFMRDKTIDLEDRWNIYLKVEKFLPVQSYLGRAIHELTGNPYDDYFPDGRGCRWNSDIDQGLQGNNPDTWEDNVELEFDDPWVLGGREQWAKRDAWREAVLQEQQGLVVFDW